MVAQPHILTAVVLLGVMALAACEGPDTLAAPPMQFVGASTQLVAPDMVDVTVTVARPREGALRAYADCVGSQYTLIRGMPYARRITSDRTGFGDVLTDKVTFLISPVPPEGDFVLNAQEVVDKCKRGGVPTF